MPDRPESSTSEPVWVPLEEVLQKARGPHLYGFYRNNLVFYGLHLFGVATLLTTDTYLQRAFKGTFWLASMRDFAYVAFLVLTLAAHATIYCHLYGSDPGWIRSETRVEDLQQPCEYCRMAPSLRSRHDFNTGQCVHKYDHFCWLLGTAIGDCNHCLFWLFNLVQTFLVAWGIVLAWDGLHNCVHFGDGKVASCWSVDPWSTAILVMILFALFLALNVFGGLLILHSYLAATNQTTYEVLRGEKVAFLKPFYLQHKGPKQRTLLGRDLLDFVVSIATGNGPPAPFSSREGPLRGVGYNLEQFFFSRKPQTYKYQTPPPALEPSL